MAQLERISSSLRLHLIGTKSDLCILQAANSKPLPKLQAANTCSCKDNDIRSIYVGQLDPNTEDRMVKEHLGDTGIPKSQVVSVTKLNSKNPQQSSFCIKLNTEVAESVALLPESWPKGVKVRPFAPEKKPQKSEGNFGGRNDRGHSGRRPRRHHHHSDSHHYSRPGKRRHQDGQYDPSLYFHGQDYSRYDYQNDYDYDCFDYGYAGNQVILSVIGVYFPYENGTIEQTEMYIETLNKVKVLVESLIGPVIVIGDFNTVLPDRDMLSDYWFKVKPFSNRSAILYDAIVENNMCVANFVFNQKVNYTYFKAGSKSYIDHVLIPQYCIKMLEQCTILYDDGSNTSFMMLVNSKAIFDQRSNCV